MESGTFVRFALCPLTFHVSSYLCCLQLDIANHGRLHLIWITYPQNNTCVLIIKLPGNFEEKIARKIRDENCEKTIEKKMRDEFQTKFAQKIEKKNSGNSRTEMRELRKKVRENFTIRLKV